jgi:hypothetical protein
MRSPTGLYGIGAGDVAVDVALRFAGDSGRLRGELCRLSAPALLRLNTGTTCPSIRRIHRLPDLLPALNGRRAQGSSPCLFDAPNADARLINLANGEVLGALQPLAVVRAGVGHGIPGGERQ